MKVVINDGGRKAANFKGTAGDCVARAVSIAAERSYAQTYFELAALQSNLRKTKRRKKAGIKSANNGIYVKSKAFKDYMAKLGFSWVPTMLIGSGCKTHLAKGELPGGRLVVSLSRHYTAVIDGVIHDTYDPSRDGTRCVYGYWRKRAPEDRG